MQMPPCYDFVTPLGTLTSGVPGEFTGREAGCASGGMDPGGQCVTNKGMKREFSAGGVLVRRLKGEWMLAAIRPAGRPEGLWALPKGNIGEGEEPSAAALREVAEETGAKGKLDRKLGDVKYVYT